MIESWHRMWCHLAVRPANGYHILYWWSIIHCFLVIFFISHCGGILTLLLSRMLVASGLLFQFWTTQRAQSLLTIGVLWAVQCTLVHRRMFRVDDFGNLLYLGPPRAPSVLIFNGLKRAIKLSGSSLSYWHILNSNSANRTFKYLVLPDSSRIWILVIDRLGARVILQLEIIYTTKSSRSPKLLPLRQDDDDVAARVLQPASYWLFVTWRSPWCDVTWCPTGNPGLAIRASYRCKFCVTFVSKDL